jgi:hypothetical protein
MAQTNRLDLGIQVSNAPSFAAPFAGGPSAPIDFFHVFIEGLNPGQVGWVFRDERSLVLSASEDLDFAVGGGLHEVDGTAIAGTRLRVLAVYNEGPGELEVGPPAAGILWMKATTEAVKVKPGGIMVWCCGSTDVGVPITAVSADLLRVTEVGVGATTYQIYAAGI